MEIIDKTIACKRMIETLEPVRGPSVKTQQNWLAAYLQKKAKKTKDESYRVWSSVFYKDEADSKECYGLFDKVWITSAKMVRFQKCYEVKIYKTELEKINSCQLKTVWQKLLLLVTLMYCKMTKTFDLDYIMFGVFAKYIGKRPCDVSCEMANEILLEAIRVGIIEEKSSVEWDYYEGEEVEREYYAIHEFPDDRVPTLMWNAYDVIEMAKLFDTNMICDECGNLFEAGCRTKTKLCPECWKEKEKKRIKLAVKNNRSKM